MISLFFALNAALCAATEDSEFASREDFAQLRVVLDESSTLVEKQAAQTFVEYWRAITGHEPPIETDAAFGSINVWIGTAGERFVDPGTRRWLGADGVYLKTEVFGARIVRHDFFNAHTARLPTRSRNLVLAGGHGAGAYYAVLEFFERYMGVRWWAPDAIHIPEAPETLPHIDYQHKPPFPYRDISYRAYVDDPGFAALHRLNGFWSETSDKFGGHTSYVRGWPGYGHTMHYFVPPDRYFETHPEFFAEVDGQRTSEGQLCLTNPDVLKLTIDGARELLRNRKPHERIISLTQMDLMPPCTCAECSALDEKEGSHSATILQFVNTVAETLEPEFPGVLFDTFAYMYSRTPPKTIRPRANVIVRLCAIEADYSTPLDDLDSERNAAFAEDLRAWADIANHLYVWDYTQNWYSHQGPHPNMPVFFPNAAFFAENGVEGVFEQASPFSPHSDFEFLKGYLLAKALWNPNDDWRTHYDDFIAGYYGPAAPYIHDYLQRITQRVQQDDVVMHFINRMDWMDVDLVAQCLDIFDEAFETVTEEPYRQRLEYAAIPVKYAALVGPPNIQRTDDAYILTRTPGQTYEAYWNDLMEFGVTHLEDYPIDAFRQRLGGKTPPRHEEWPIVRMSSGPFEAWTLPDAGGAIVRLRDTKHDIDYLDGWQDPTQGTGALTDWFFRDSAIEGNPVNARYEIASQPPDALTLTATLGEGVQLTRTIATGDESIVVTQTIANTGTDPLIPDVGLRIILNARGRRSPRLTIEDQTHRLTHDAEDKQNTGALSLTETGQLHIDLAGRHTELSVTAQETMTAQYHFNPDTDTLHLVFQRGEAPLPPGQSRQTSIVLTPPTKTN